MSWLKHIQPVLLHQSSDIPYVILEDGVKLCYSNFYSVDPCSNNEFNISFKASKNELERQSATYYRFKHFPVIVPFENIAQLNKTIIDGKIIKSASFTSRDTISVGVVKSSYVDSLNDNEFNQLVDLMEQQERMVILTSDPLGSASHLLIDENAIPVYESGDCVRTCVAVAHYASPKHGRKYCWTRHCPELKITCYGFDDTDEMSLMSDSFAMIGVPAFEIDWVSDLDEFDF
jgi:hypothetical protein